MYDRRWRGNHLFFFRVCDEALCNEWNALADCYLRCGSAGGNGHAMLDSLEPASLILLLLLSLFLIGIYSHSALSPADCGPIRAVPS